MELLERATIMHWHRHRIASYGVDAVEALGWRNEASQRQRFEVIAAVADFSHSTVLDIGCGKGDLKAFLDARFEGVSYLGIDQQPEFIAAARRRFAGDESAMFVANNFARMALPRADHVVACGVLGYRSAEPCHVFQSIARFFSAARETVIFNVLDAAIFTDRHPLLIGRDLEAIEAFCRQLGGRLEITRGYADDDATFVMRLN